MSNIVQFIADQGVNIETIYLILALPFVATLIAAFRQVAGIRSFGIYTPLVLTFAFWAIGLKYGLAVFAVILVVGVVVRYILKDFHLLYMSKVAIVLTVISLAILILLAVAGYFQRRGFASTSILPILILITLIEKFAFTQVEKGFRTAATLSIGTLVIATVCYYFVVWDVFRSLVLNHPEYIFIALIIDAFLGKWTGLRLSEYLRFRKVIKNVRAD